MSGNKQDAHSLLRVNQTVIIEKMRTYLFDQIAPRPYEYYQDKMSSPLHEETYAANMEHVEKIISTEGVCRGLSTAWSARQQSDTAECFNRDLQKIAAWDGKWPSLQKDKSLILAFESLIPSVAVVQRPDLQNPEIFPHPLNQREDKAHVLDLVLGGERRIEHKMNMQLNFNVKEFERVLETALKHPDDMYVLGANGHAIAVAVKEDARGKPYYLLYDPNQRGVSEPYGNAQRYESVEELVVGKKHVYGQERVGGIVDTVTGKPWKANPDARQPTNITISSVDYTNAYVKEIQRLESRSKTHGLSTEEQDTLHEYKELEQNYQTRRQGHAYGTYSDVLSAAGVLDTSALAPASDKESSLNHYVKFNNPDGIRWAITVLEADPNFHPPESSEKQA